VVVERFTDLLPFPRNLLAPLLRGGGIATLPPDPRFMRYGDFIRAAVDARSPERAPPGPLELADEVVEPDALLKKVMGAAAPAPGRERWLIAASLAEIDVLAQALRALHAGADLVLSPRLDRRTLDKVARQAGTVREIR